MCFRPRPCTQNGAEGLSKHQRLEQSHLEAVVLPERAWMTLTTMSLRRCPLSPKAPALTRPLLQLPHHTTLFR